MVSEISLELLLISNHRIYSAVLLNISDHLFLSRLSHTGKIPENRYSCCHRSLPAPQFYLSGPRRTHQPGKGQGGANHLVPVDTLDRCAIGPVHFPRVCNICPNPEPPCRPVVNDLRDVLFHAVFGDGSRPNREVKGLDSRLILDYLQ